jgi:glycosyltransferase involved in cell wall biosynthesis
MTVHDLIAYQVPAYHRTPNDWFAYRTAMRKAAGEVDGIVVISSDVQRQLRLERLPIEDERVFTVANGVDHLTGREAETCPEELVRRGFSAAAAFLLVLGTDYAHKNRDKAIDVLRALRARGHALELVLVGAHVPYGSSRAAEASAIDPELPVHVIPDVTSEERNWLLRHAAVVLYPTSAEGFGLIPHEAAAFGTPTVLVPFGPLGERFPTLPAAPRNWGTDELTAATDALLRDPSLAQAQIETLARDTELYDWSVTAAKVVDVYRALLARPARRPRITEQEV